MLKGISNNYQNQLDIYYKPKRDIKAFNNNN